MNESDLKGEITLHVMRGLPRSGKSTQAKWIQQETGAPVVSKDAIRLALHGQRYLAEREGQVKEAYYLLLKALAFGGNKVIIIDECNVNQPSTIKILKEVLEGFEIDFIFHVCSTSPEVCKQRAIECNQRDLIPVIDSMSRDWISV